MCFSSPANLKKKSNVIFTDHVDSAMQGNVFTRVYDSIHGEGGGMSCPGPPRWGTEGGYILSRFCHGMGSTSCPDPAWGGGGAGGMSCLGPAQERGKESMIRWPYPSWIWSSMGEGVSWLGDHTPSARSGLAGEGVPWLGDPLGYPLTPG